MKREELIKELEDLLEDIKNMNDEVYNWELGNIDEWLCEIRGKI